MLAKKPAAKARTIHFIHRVDKSNTGDMSSCPLNYHEDYFREHFDVMRHDIGAVDFDSIKENDAIILGGGGLLYCLNEWQQIINKLLRRCPNLIGWGLGFNSHYDSNEKLTDIDLSKFSLLSVRDHEYKKELRYCPCVSALAFKKTTASPKADIGVISQFDRPIESLYGKPLKHYDIMDTSKSIGEIAAFITNHRTIITNSYHGTYWSQLLRRKAIIVNPISTKFSYFKYAPQIYSGDLAGDINGAQNYNNALRDALRANKKFFKAVKTYLNDLP